MVGFPRAKCVSASRVENCEPDPQTQGRVTAGIVRWRPSVATRRTSPHCREAGVEKPGRADGFNPLRHFYASVLPDA
jgi:hypothetical protein